MIALRRSGFSRELFAQVRGRVLAVRVHNRPLWERRKSRRSCGSDVSRELSPPALPSPGRRPTSKISSHPSPRDWPPSGFTSRASAGGSSPSRNHWHVTTAHSSSSDFASCTSQAGSSASRIRSRARPVCPPASGFAPRTSPAHSAVSEIPSCASPAHSSRPGAFVQAARTCRRNVAVGRAPARAVVDRVVPEGGLESALRLTVRSRARTVRYYRPARCVARRQGIPCPSC